MGFSIEIKEMGNGARGKIIFNDKRYIIFEVEDRIEISRTVYKILCKFYKREGKIKELQSMKMRGFDYRNFIL
jgi:hypothetical protein